MYELEVKCSFVDVDGQRHSSIRSATVNNYREALALLNGATSAYYTMEDGGLVKTDQQLLNELDELVEKENQADWADEHGMPKFL